MMTSEQLDLWQIVIESKDERKISDALEQIIRISRERRGVLDATGFNEKDRTTGKVSCCSG